MSAPCGWLVLTMDDAPGCPTDALDELISAVDNVLKNSWTVYGLRAKGITAADMRRLERARAALASTEEAR